MRDAILEREVTSIDLPGTIYMYETYYVDRNTFEESLFPDIYLKADYCLDSADREALEITPYHGLGGGGIYASKIHPEGANPQREELDEYVCGFRFDQVGEVLLERLLDHDRYRDINSVGGATQCKRCHRGTSVQLDGLKFHGRSSSILLAG